MPSIEDEILALQAQKQQSQAVPVIQETQQPSPIEDEILHLQDQKLNGPSISDRVANFTSGYVEPFMGELGRDASAALKPVAMAATPVTEGVRGAIQLAKGEPLDIDPYAEFKTFRDGDTIGRKIAPSSKFGFTPLLNEIAPATSEPISATFGKIPDNRFFPETTKALNSVSPNNIADLRMLNVSAPIASSAVYGTGINAIRGATQVLNESRNPTMNDFSNKIMGSVPQYERVNVPDKNGVPQYNSLGEQATDLVQTGHTGGINFPGGDKPIPSWMNQMNRMKLAKNIVRAGSNDANLLTNLEDEGKLNNVAQRIIDNPELNKIDRSQVVDNLGGEQDYNKNQYGVQRGTKTGGLINREMQPQNEFVNNLPNDKFSYDKVEANLRAKDLVRGKGLLPSQESAAFKKIDEMLPYNDYDKDQLDLIDNKNEVFDQKKNLDREIYNKRADTVDSLEKQKSETIQQKEKIPFFVENKDRVPGESRVYKVENTPRENPYTLDPINGSRKGDIPTDPNVTYKRDYIPPVGDEQVWNKEGASTRLELRNKIADMDQQIKTLSGESHTEHPALKGMVEKRNALQASYDDMNSSGFPDRETYKEHIDKLNQGPIQEANDARVKANKYKSGLVKATEDYTSHETAATAAERAAREAIDHVVDSADPSEIHPNDVEHYHERQSKVSDLLNLKDLYKGSYASGNPQPQVPMLGGIGRSALRQGLNLKGTYIDPMLLDKSTSILNEDQFGNNNTTMVKLRDNKYMGAMSLNPSRTYKEPDKHGKVMNWFKMKWEDPNE